MSERQNYKLMFEFASQQLKAVREERDKLIEANRQFQLECLEARKLARQYLDALHALDAAPETEWLPWEMKGEQ